MNKAELEVCNLPKTIAEIPKRLNLEIKNGFKTLGIYTVIAGVLVFLFAYCLYNMIMIIQFYVSQKEALKSTARPKTNNPNNPRDDNELYINIADNMTAEDNDEYVKYTQEINKNISQFKTYNERLKAYYKENKPGETPADMIDRDILDDTADNYNR